MNTTTQEQKPAAADRRPTRTSERRAPIVPAAIGLVRAAAAISRFVVTVGMSADRRDPILFVPQILRAA